MCLLGIAFHQIPDAPLAILANREEAYARPATGPALHRGNTAGPAWLGGIDLLAGGTWLGVNPRGMVVAVTNRRREIVPLAPRSRGLLCRSLLGLDRAENAMKSGIDQLQSGHYAGCNLLVADSERAFVIEFGDVLQYSELTAGLNLLTNGELNAADDPRIARVRQELNAVRPSTIPKWIEASTRICGLRGADEKPSIVIEGTDRGTVSATVLALGRNPQASQFWHAPGPPSITPFVDLSPLLRQIIGPSNSVHRIPLRGPWRFRGAGESERTAKFPARWSDLFGDWNGSAEFRRTFHPPSNLNEERVTIAIEGLQGPASISLNGIRIGEVGAGQSERGRDWRGEITRQLVPNNELLIELPQWPAANASQTHPIWKSVTLEITK